MCCELAKGEFTELVRSRRGQLRSFLSWALDEEIAAQNGEPWRSLRLADRDDIEAARQAVVTFTEVWWGLVVYSAFGSLIGAEAVRSESNHPLTSHAMAKVLRRPFPRGSVGHHRRRRGVDAAKDALFAASSQSTLFRNALEGDGDFDRRYWLLRNGEVREWGRTTCFDLLVRAGRLGVGGAFYEPQYVYFLGATGPARGFERIWGVPVRRANVWWAERIVANWHERWDDVAEAAGVDWRFGRYSPGDLENALCIWSHSARRCAPNGNGRARAAIC